MSGAHSDKVTNKCLMPSRYQSTDLLLLLLLLSDGTCVSVYVYNIYIWFLLSLLLLFDSDAPVVVAVRSEIGVIVASLGGLGNNIDTLLSVRILIM